MNIALFDLDGSLADFDKAMYRDLMAIASPQDKLAFEFSNFRELEKHEWINARMELIKNQPGWWLNLEPIEMGFKVLEAAKSIGFECRILTKGPGRHPVAWREKVEWCNKHVPGLAIDIVTNKGQTYGKVLYDDYDKYMLEWLEHRPRGLGILPITKPISDDSKIFWHPNVILYDGPHTFDLTVNALQRAYDR